MQLYLVGLSYRNSPVELREQFTIPLRDLPEALHRLHSISGCRELVILSTCNRIELYAVALNPANTFQELINFLSYKSRLNPEVFQGQLYCLSGSEAIAHIFRVASGLDSVILGESEITAQVKEAYHVARAQGRTGAILNRLFQKALHAAKEIRNSTGIARGKASIGAVVTSLVQELFADRLATCEVLLWGSGKAAEAIARHLIKQGIGRLWIVNRTQFKAQGLALLCKSGWLSWEQAHAHLAHVDIAIVCTQAPHYVIDAEDMFAIQAQRHACALLDGSSGGRRHLCLIDLAVPRNIDPTLAQAPGVTLYDIDALNTLVQDGVSARRAELPQCTALIERQVGYFLRRHDAFVLEYNHNRSE